MAEEHNGKVKHLDMAQSINCRQENAGTSCLARKTGSEAILNFIIAFRLTRNPYPQKTTDKAIIGWKMLTLLVFGV